jgi:hypothetical protein
MEKTAFQIGAEEAIAKTAKEEKKEPGWFAKQKAQARAMRAGDKGMDRYMIDPKLRHERDKKSLKGLVRGGLKGAGVGGIAGAAAALASGNKKRALESAIGGAGVGAYGGAVIGSARGMAKADKKYLKKKGIDIKWGGLKVSKMSPAAKKKYLEKKYKGGGAKD